MLIWSCDEYRKHQYPTFNNKPIVYRDKDGRSWFKLITTEDMREFVQNTKEISKTKQIPYTIETKSGIILVQSTMWISFTVSPIDHHLYANELMFPQEYRDYFLSHSIAFFRHKSNRHSPNSGRIFIGSLKAIVKEKRTLNDAGKNTNSDSNQSSAEGSGGTV